MASTASRIYNLHANIDPRIRPLIPTTRGDAFGLLVDFINPALHLEPDLAILAFLEENTNDLHKWDTLLSEGMHMPGIDGCDAHENAFPSIFPDGERGDSYRRMIKWASNHLLVHTRTYDGEQEALRAGRLYVAFEAFGSPVGFDFSAMSGGALAEMGDTVPPGAMLRLVLPQLQPDVPVNPPPTFRLRILRAAAGGAVEVANATGDASMPPLTYTATEPGAYRAEVRITPTNARPYLGHHADAMVHEYV